MVTRSNNQNNQARSGFFSDLLNALKLVGSATFGLPLALAATAAVGVTFATTWCINGVASAVQKIAVGEIKNPLTIPFKYQTALKLVGKSWDFFLFPYKKASGQLNLSQTSLPAFAQATRKVKDKESISPELDDQYAANQFYFGDRDDGHHHGHHHPGTEVSGTESSPLVGRDSQERDVS